MHYRNIKFFLQTLLNLEALRSLDILKVDTSECWSDCLYSLDELVWVFLVYLDIKHIDTTVNLEQQALTFHNRLSAHRAYVAQTQNCRTVTDNGNQVTLACIFVCILWVLLNLKTRFSNTR